jgi:hypothetical protein
MYVLVKEVMKQVHTRVEYYLHLWLLHHIVKNDLSMVMVNIIPRDQLLSDEHHHNHPELDVVNVVVCSIMPPPVIVLNVVPDDKFELFIFVLNMVLVCTTVCF